jgi:hypothetical protein
MIPLPRDFQDFLRLLNATAIRYVVIVGYAVAYHGYVRYTGDLDLFVVSPSAPVQGGQSDSQFHSLAAVTQE